MRLNKYISLCGVASRRGADELVRDSKVTLNGEIVHDLGRQVNPGDVVAVNGQVIKAPQKTTVLAFHKPAGCVCTNRDPQGRQTVYDFLPPGYHGLKYIGRLDLQSRGLLLFTDDGELLHRLTLPQYKVYRHYLVWTDRYLSENAAQKLTDGVDLGENSFGDREVGFAEAVFFNDDCVELVLSEGKNREIRRMMQAIGYEIEDLQRIAYADVDLGDLPVGEYRELTEKEVNSLRKICGL